MSSQPPDDSTGSNAIAGTRQRIALAGNPNAGKSTLFNALTGARQTVGNFPGVTVERRSGAFVHGSHSYEVVDLPGTYSLLGADIHAEAASGAGTQSENSTTTVHRGVDEQIAAEQLHRADIDVIVNVVDACALARSLTLTLELLDTGKPVVLALNMLDVADSQGIHIDIMALSSALSIPVIPLIASRREGILPLLDAVDSAVPAQPQKLPTAVEALLPAPQANNAEQTHTRLQQIEQVIANNSMHSSAILLARYERVDELVQVCLSQSPMKSTMSQRLDALLLHRWLGIPAFLAIMYALFVISINVGSAFIDFFDITAAALFVELPRLALESAGVNAWLTVLLADGVGGGIQLVCTFIPVIGALFICLAFLEDSGYMARAAFVVDGLMRRIGLPGKAFVPLIVGFGCNVPAVMATRTLDRAGDRLLTVIMAPFMSCGARLTVYALFAAAFFPEHGGQVVFFLYMLGIVVAVGSAWLIRRSILGPEEGSFLLELPAYHLPTLRGILLHSWHRLKGFVLRAGKAIVMVVVVLNVLDSIGTDGSVGRQGQEDSLLSATGKAITPVFSPMGISENNWPATVGLFTGIFAKEVVVGTLDALYSQSGGDNEVFVLSDALTEAVATIPANLAELGGAVLDPLGLTDLQATDNLTSAAEQQGVNYGTLIAMQKAFGSSAAALAYLVFILLYMPCVATIGAIAREQGVYWAMFSTVWSLTIAYTLAVILYQLGTLHSSAWSNLLWCLGMVALLVGVFMALLGSARRTAARQRLIPVVQIN